MVLVWYSMSLLTSLTLGFPVWLMGSQSPITWVVPEN